MNKLLSDIRAELAANVDEKTRNSAKHFFKEQIKVYGVKTATVEKIARKYWPQVKTYGKPEIFALCEELLRSDYHGGSLRRQRLAAKIHPLPRTRRLGNVSNSGSNATSTTGQNATASATTPSAT